MNLNPDDFCPTCRPLLEQAQRDQPRRPYAPRPDDAATVERWLTEKTHESDRRETRGWLYGALASWCRAEGLDVPPRHALYAGLRAAGYREVIVKGTRFFAGLTTRTEVAPVGSS